jgi:hypothetical protein
MNYCFALFVAGVTEEVDGVLENAYRAVYWFIIDFLVGAILL